MSTKILLISKKKSYAAKRLTLEAKKAGVSLSILAANEITGINPKNFDVLYVRDPYVKQNPKFLVKVIALAKKFKAAGKKVVDAVIVSGNLGEGKGADYRRLKRAGLAIPNTQVLSRRSIPKAWPFILKWIYGFKAKHTFLIQNQKHFNEVFEKYPKGELLVQEFVPAEFEYKIITVGYKALPVAIRFKIDNLGFRIDFSSARGISTLLLPAKLIQVAERASKALGRELAKVDILESKGKFYILEVNRFPGFDTFEELTKFNVAKEFIGYLQAKTPKSGSLQKSKFQL